MPQRTCKICNNDFQAIGNEQECGCDKAASEAAIAHARNMTKQDKLERIALLSDEIDANEEENRLNQQEINKLYAEIDAGNYDEPASAVATA